MRLLPNVGAKYLARFDGLIAEGERIRGGIKVIAGEWHEPFFSTFKPHKDPDRHVVEWPAFVKWRAQAVSLLDQVIPASSAHRTTVDAVKGLRDGRSQVDFLIGTLQAIKDDFEAGMFDDLVLRVEAVLANDYLEQATALLGETLTDAVHYVPAAVMAGAVLERGLRALCAKHDPPLDVEDKFGRPFGMSQLIDSLKKAGVFNEAKAKQLRAWADIRNAAAHGEFAKFRGSDVELMIKGVETFLNEYLR